MRISWAEMSTCLEPLEATQIRSEMTPAAATACTHQPLGGGVDPGAGDKAGDPAGAAAGLVGDASDEGAGRPGSSGVEAVGERAALLCLSTQLIWSQARWGRPVTAMSSCIRSEASQVMSCMAVMASAGIFMEGCPEGGVDAKEL